MGYIMEIREAVGSRPLIMAGAAVMVRNERNEILLQLRTDTLDWGTVGGAMEPGESFEETACRELLEETGLRARSLKLVTVLSGSDMYFRYPNGDEVYNVVAVFETCDVEGELRMDDGESMALRYFSLDETLPPLNSVSANILRRAGYIGAGHT